MLPQLVTHSTPALPHQQDTERVKDVVARIKAAYKAHVDGKVASQTSTDHLDTIISVTHADFKAPTLDSKRGRHFVQQAAIVGNMVAV